jgi:polyphosphate kinase 2 (PPK2 family)
MMSEYTKHARQRRTGNEVVHIPRYTHDNVQHLRLTLLENQLQLLAQKKKKNKSVLILINGVELAGKGEAVTQLREWVDPRYLKVLSPMAGELADNMPFWQRYATGLPANGEIVVLFGNWYADLLYTCLHSKKKSQEALATYLEHMHAFESYLNDQGVTLVKCWFDSSWSFLQKQLAELDDGQKKLVHLLDLDWSNKKEYDKIQALRKKYLSDYVVIDDEDARKRAFHLGHLVLHAIKTPTVAASPSVKKWQHAAIPYVLQHPDTHKTDKNQYKTALAKKQQQAVGLLRAHIKHAGVVIMFEGMDAAGKGGAIKRLVSAMDPREYEINNISAPSEHELQYPYLWRFWCKMPHENNLHNMGISIFDRSWYGRVLVERVEELIPDGLWQRSYEEINQFEQQLHDCGIKVIKFWLSISADEQLSRFMSRQETPYKKYKLTNDDWRNRGKWDAYLQAAADMFAHTSTDHSPWHVIATNDKRAARLQVLDAIIKHLEDK